MNLRTRSYLALSVTALLAAGVSTAACDVTVVSPDDGGQIDASQFDGNVVDAKLDTGKADTGIDTGVLDSGPDSKADSATDGGADGGIDAGPSTAIADFYERAADAYCTKLKSCCAVAAPAYNLVQCKTEFKQQGGYYFALSGLVALNSPAQQVNLRLNAAKAAACIAVHQSAVCTNLGAGRGATEDRASVVDCLNAVEGTLAANATCKVDLECGPNLFCAEGVGGAVGTCQPLSAAGASCVRKPPGTAGNYRDSCSNHGSGDTGRWCANGTCVDLYPAGQPQEPTYCLSILECAAGSTCDGTGICSPNHFADDVCAQQ
jgi:hypothetical protein